MADEKEPSVEVKESDGLERFNSVMLGLLFLLISAFMTLCLVLATKPEDGKPGFTAGEFFCFLLILPVVWSLTIGFFLSCSRKAQLKTIAEGCHTVAAVFFSFFLIAISINAIGSPSGSVVFASIESGPATVAVVLVFFLGVGLLCLIRGMGKAKDETLLNALSFAVFWPLTLVLKARLVGVLFLVLLCGVVYLGERVGARSGHPLLGACGGLAVVFVVLGLVGVVSSISSEQNREGGEG